jgi:hypothetical protein
MTYDYHRFGILQHYSWRLTWAGGGSHYNLNVELEGKRNKLEDIAG